MSGGIGQVGRKGHDGFRDQGQGWRNSHVHRPGIGSRSLSGSSTSHGKPWNRHSNKDYISGKWAGGGISKGWQETQNGLVNKILSTLVDRNNSTWYGPSTSYVRPFWGIWKDLDIYYYS